MAIKADAGGGEGAGRVRSTLAEINVIPLVDVVLVLLLIFMLTAPMMYRGIDVNLPRTSSRPTAVEERLVLTLTKERLLYLNDRAVPLATLETRLREVLRDRTDKTVFVKADKDLAYGYVVETMDRIRRAGVEKVGMVTEPLPPRG
jgi:biopolymer transport protein TolR